MLSKTRSGIVRKTFGIADVIKQSLSPLQKKIPFAFIFGSVARRDDNRGSDLEMKLLQKEIKYD